jgi:itaconyl-CoA hydratase
MPMAGSATQVSERTYRERFGRYFEDFRVGDIYQHRPGRTITAHDNVQFTLLTMNTHPLHFDEHYAKQTEFGRCIVCSPLTVALMVGMSVTDVSQKAIANLGWSEIRLVHPLYPGDTLYAESEVLSLRESRSRADAGIVTVRTSGRNQDGVLVCDFSRTVLVLKRGSGEALELRANY